MSNYDADVGEPLLLAEGRMTAATYTHRPDTTRALRLRSTSIPPTTEQIQRDRERATGPRLLMRPSDGRSLQQAMRGFFGVPDEFNEHLPGYDQLLNAAALQEFTKDPRSKTLKGWLMMHVARTDFVRTYEALDLLPFPRFVEEDYEESFKHHTNLMIGDVVGEGVFGLEGFYVVACLFIFILLVAVGRGALASPVPLLAAIALLCMTLGGAAMALLVVPKRVECIRHIALRREYIMNCALAMGFIGSIVFFAFTTHYASVLMRAGTANTTSSPLQWNAVALLAVWFLYFTTTATHATCFPTRMKHIFWVMLFYVFGTCCATRVYIHRVLYRQHKLDDVGPTEFMLHFAIWAWCIIYMRTALMEELKTRVDFFVMTNLLNGVRDVDRDVQRQLDHDGLTHYDEVLRHVHEVLAILKVKRVEYFSGALLQASRSLAEVLFELGNAGDLFRNDIKTLFTNIQDKRLIQIVDYFNKGSPVRASQSVGSRAPSWTSPLDSATNSPPPSSLGVLPPVLPHCMHTRELNQHLGRKWDYDLEHINGRGNILMEVGTVLLTKHLGGFGVRSKKLHGLLYSIQQYYFDNPYHNALHAAAVAHAAHWLVRTLRMHTCDEFTPLVDTTFTLAALGHDMAHPGRRSSYFVNTRHPLATLYNDAAVMDNFHCAAMFAILGRRECNIFTNVNYHDYELVRRRMIGLFMALDSSGHFKQRAIFSGRRTLADFDCCGNPVDMWLTLEMCLKAADFSHCALSWAQHYQWSMRIREEFYRQGDDERSAELEVSFLCNRLNEDKMCCQQKNFLRVAVLPVYRELNAASGGLLKEPCLRPLVANLLRWEERVQFGITTSIPPAVRGLPSQTHMLQPVVKMVLRKMVGDADFGIRQPSFVKMHPRSILLKNRKTIQRTAEMQNLEILQKGDVVTAED